MTPLALRVSQVAEILGMSTSAVYDAVQRGEFTNVGIGRAVRIPRREIEARIGSPITPEPSVAVVSEGTFT